MPDLLRFDDQNQQRSSDFVIFTVASNFSLFFSASSSIDCCSFASDVHDHDSFVSQLTQPGILKVSEADRLSSFFDSYGLGIRMINGLEGLLLSSLDAKLTPKHLFRRCLEHEQKLNSSHKSAHAYNFYKDSNAPVMVKMVELLTILQQRIVFLLNECDDHPALQKIVDVIEMILAIPLSTPLAKALSGLQFLLNRVQVLQETVSKFPLSAELDPIFNLVSSWKKLEFESWPALLDDVQIQFEINARKLWFPLYSVLQRRHSADIAEYNRSTIQSLEEFIQTSTVGEFRKRLQLLNFFSLSMAKLAPAQTATKCFSSLEGDHLTLINVYRAFDEFLEKSKIGINQEKAEKSLRKWCKENFINSCSLRHAREIHRKIQRNVEQMGLRITSCVEKMLQYRRCLAAACSSMQL